MTEILKKIKTDFEYYTGSSFRGLIYALGSSFASRLKEFEDKLEFMKKNAFISTADKDYLYLNASSLLPPEAPQKAKGYITVYGSRGIEIPTGTELSDDDTSYKTISAGKIEKIELQGITSVTNGTATVNISNSLTNTTAMVNGYSKKITVVNSNTIQFDSEGIDDGDNIILVVNAVVLQVLAEDFGEIYNKDLNDIIKFKTTQTGVNTEAGILSIVGGKDEEDVEDYRLRVKDFLSNPQAPFSKVNIAKTIFDNIKNIKYVWIKNNEDDNNILDKSIKVLAINKDYTLSQEEIDGIKQGVELIKPANFSSSALTVSIPTVENFNIVIDTLLPSSDGLRNEITKNLRYKFGGDNFEKEITQANIESVIYNTKNGMEQVISFSLSSGWKSKENYKFWRLEDVIFQ